MKSVKTEAIIGDAVTSVVEYAREVGKPVVIELLDFRQKKAALENQSRRYSRMLSSFSYGEVKACFISRGYREGVEVRQLNPAFSSVIGRVKFMERYGLSVHQAAALLLARRLLGCSERITRRRVCPVCLHRTCKEAGEARVDVLGSGIGAAETGACSAAPAGEACARTQSGSGYPRGGLSGDQFRCSWVRFPSGAALHCWGGGAAQTASSGMADGSRATKINHFYNGAASRGGRLVCQRITPA